MRASVRLITMRFQVIQENRPKCFPARLDQRFGEVRFENTKAPILKFRDFLFDRHEISDCISTKCLSMNSMEVIGKFSNLSTDQELNGGNGVCEDRFAKELRNAYLRLQLDYSVPGSLE